ncbi:MAG: tetratricopeptide repeat protein [Polyangiaceae bacterium]|nr:tetratricopeptide repeat protein [Polyangiaceae bacterium]
MTPHPSFAIRGSWLPLVLGMIVAGCGAATPGGSSRVGTDPARGPAAGEELPRTIVTPDGVSDVPELYAEARRTLEAGDARTAAQRFDRIVRLDPDGELAPDALYLAALAHEEAGDRQAALERFEQLARRYPEHPLGREAIVRAMRLLVFFERFARAESLADRALSQKLTFGVIEQTVVHSSKALGLLARGEVEAASLHVEKARGLIEDNRLDSAGQIPRDLAQAYFALGEVRRVRADAIRFDPVPPDFARVLEERCQHLLDAQRAYSDTMRAYDSHWSAMAGYRVGELYKRLHDDLMRMPKPKAADTDARAQLFEGAMRLRYSVLLDKALAMMEHTLQMAKRTGEASAWVVKAEQARRELEQARKKENEAIAKLPYTRAQLQQALDDLQQKKRTEKQAGGA